MMDLDLSLLETEKIYTTYAPETDMTFILRDIIKGNDLKSIECIGWYYGKPNEKDTEQFIGSMEAEYL